VVVDVEAWEKEVGDGQRGKKGGRGGGRGGRGGGRGGSGGGKERVVDDAGDATAGA